MESSDRIHLSDAISRVCDLRAGETGIVVSVEDDAREAKRLADLGFARGAGVEMLRTGKPCLVRTGGTFVGLGERLQRAIRIQPVGNES